MNIDVPFDVTLPWPANDKHCKVTGDDGRGGTLYSCAVSDASGKLLPGQTVTQQVPFTLARSAPGPQELGKVGVLVVPLDDKGQPTEDWHKLDGPNTVWVPITSTANHYNYAVTATTASGKVGDTVTSTATGTNNGPADMIGGTVTIVAPTGTTLAELPKTCTWVTQGHKATCDNPTTIVAAGKSASLDLKLTINNATVGKDGSISVAPKSPGDTNAANNSAPLDVTVTGGGTGAGNGSPTLPVTGTSTGLIAGTGAAVVLVGGLLAFFGYRRTRRPTRG
jgi:Domain of unknown function DUF11